MKKFALGFSFVTLAALSNITLAAGENVPTETPTIDLLSRGINQLGAGVLANMELKEKDKNLFISPFSLHEALSMALVGSEGATRDELAKLLGFSAPLTNEALSEAWQKFRGDVSGADKNVKFDIANSMWGNSDQHVEFLKTFIDLNKTAHSAEIRDVSFKAKDFPAVLNRWVSDQTHGKIPEILQPPISPLQLFFLVNAVYFKGAWDIAFDKKLTKKADFFLSNKKKVKTDFMSQKGSYSFYEDEGLQAVRLPFGKEKRFSMAIYVPKAKKTLTPLTPLMKNFEVSVLEKVRAGFKRSKGSVELPRFKIEYRNEQVVEILKAMNVKVAFSDGAEFPHIVAPKSGGKPSKIDIIIHQAVVEVNEEGAEAAAATVIGYKMMTMPPPEPPFVFKADRPFYFEIADIPTNTIVFAGILKTLK